ncbi:osmC-like protein [Seminavis robusta]|uniref:OsmC-like protein n=1 Tax=Seminavis robusta TaxID=568900 RepID=A0A9N8HCC1_9STRA|nr:osmC-like protein [Seminavis robusta]|eukprot:Sro213_g088570.1 osmC-like protein (586) ;mRNA; f:73462-75523
MTNSKSSFFSPTRWMNLPHPPRGKLVVVLGAIVFFVLAVVVPISLKIRPSHPHSNESLGLLEDASPVEVALSDGEDTDANFTLRPSPGPPGTISPSTYTHSILPLLDDDDDDDDSISDYQDDAFEFLRPLQVDTSSPQRSGSPSPAPPNASSFEPSAVNTSTPSSIPLIFTSSPSTSTSSAGSLDMLPSQLPSSSSQQPSLSPSDAVTFVPGLLTHLEHGLLLSEGLTAQIIAESGQPVKYWNGTTSKLQFHGMPDFGATFEDLRDDNPNGWVYLSNSEMEEVGSGSVGSIIFDSEGHVIRYERLLSNTTMNCGGGITPFNTWISCEETKGGRNYQVDPMNQLVAAPITLGKEGGHWESFAFDVRNKSSPRFFVTEDAEKGALQRFTPHNATWDPPEQAWKMLHGDGLVEYLLLEPNSGQTSGTFSWGSNRAAARNNAFNYYPQSEGIDVHEGRLFFVCKKVKHLFELDLDAGTYTRQSTTTGLFDGGPDQLHRILEDGFDDFLFFTEEGGKDAGIHGRDATGLFFTVLESPIYNDETTGLAFSPCFKHMYVAYQQNGLLFDVTRQDGLPFYARSLNVKYHAMDR